MCRHLQVVDIYISYSGREYLVRIGEWIPRYQRYRI